MSSNPPSGSWNPNDPSYGSGSGSDPTMVPGSGQQPYGSGPYQQPYGQPQQTPSYGSPQYGSPPGGGYGGPPSGGSSPGGGGSPVMPFLAGVLATLIVVGAGVGVLFATGGGIVGDRDRETSTASDDSPSGGETDSSSPGGETSGVETSEPPESSDPTDEVTPTEGGSYDELHAACEQGDFASCDRLYLETPIGSDEEQFGSTCGGRIGEVQGYCVEWSSYTRPASGSADFERSLDQLWTQCEQGNLDSCDSLYYDSDIDSTYEAFGSTCAGRTFETEGGCTDEIDYL